MDLLEDASLGGGGGGEALWFQNPMPFPVVFSLPCVCGSGVSPQLQHQDCLPAAVFSTVMAIESTSETKSPFNVFFYKLTLLWCFVIAVEK